MRDLAIGVAILVWLVAFGYIVLSSARADTDIFLQENFPCMEDEVLTFAPHFGHERVGCVNHEDFAGIWACPYGELVGHSWVKESDTVVNVVLRCEAR